MLFFNTEIKSQRTFLPKPTGHYFVGTQNLFFTDNSRKEKLTLKASDKRSLQIKVWYPSDEAGSIENLYLKDYSGKLLYEKYRGFSDDKTFFDSLKTYKTFSYENVPVSKQKDRYPIIFFSQGFYFGLDDFYSNIMENLASNGYIVVSITHPYDQVIAKNANGEILSLNKYRASKAYFQWKHAEFLHKKNPDTANQKQINRILRDYLRIMKVFKKSLNIWTKDVQFTMDTLKTLSKDSGSNNWINRIDFSKVGTMGQSFGGAVAGQLCYVDSGIKAGVNLDCFQFGDLYRHEMKKPFMLLQSESYPLWQTANKVIYKGTEPLYSIKLNNTRHFIFSDCSLFPAEGNKRFNTLVGNTNVKSNVSIINGYILDFFEHFLNNEPFKLSIFQPKQ